MTATNTNVQQYDEQLHVLQETFPQAPERKLVLLLRRHDGNVEQVRFLYFKIYYTAR
jgi:hypothetical protein